MVFFFFFGQKIRTQICIRIYSHSLSSSFSWWGNVTGIRFLFSFFSWWELGNVIGIRFWPLMVFFLQAENTCYIVLRRFVLVSLFYDGRLAVLKFLSYEFTIIMDHQIFVPSLIKNIDFNFKLTSFFAFGPFGNINPKTPCN